MPHPNCRYKCRINTDEERKQRWKKQLNHTGNKKFNQYAILQMFVYRLHQQRWGQDSEVHVYEDDHTTINRHQTTVLAKPKKQKYKSFFTYLYF